MNEIGAIAVRLDNRSYEYDVYTLVIAFFQGIPTRVFDPDQEIPQDSDLLVQIQTESTTQVCLKELCEGGKSFERSFQTPETRPRMKNALKRVLYEMLRDYCGRDLPWGNLTGIRPVKLVMDFLRTPGGDAETKEADARRMMKEAYFVSDRKADLAVKIAHRESAILEKIRPQEGFSLYVGIPFCPSICLYCSFSSSPLKLWEKQVDAYLDAAMTASGLYIVGLYGHENLVKAMHKRGFKHFWQCVAWSNEFSDDAGVIQYEWQGGESAKALTSKIGVAVDLDAAESLDGMWKPENQAYSETELAHKWCVEMRITDDTMRDVSQTELMLWRYHNIYTPEDNKTASGLLG